MKRTVAKKRYTASDMRAVSAGMDQARLCKGKSLRRGLPNDTQGPRPQ